MEKIHSLLGQADQHRNAGNLNAAEEAYQQALDMAETDGLQELADRAANALTIIRKERLNHSTTLTLTVDSLWDKYHNAPNDIAALAYIHPLLTFSSESLDSLDHLDQSPARLYAEQLQIVRQRIVRNIKAVLAEIKQQIQAFHAQTDNSPSSCSEIEENLQKTQEMCEGKHLKFPQDIEITTVNLITHDLINHPDIQQLQQELQDLSGLIIALSQNIQTEFITHNNGNTFMMQNLAEITSESPNERAGAAMHEAQSLLQRRNDPNFKSAIRLLKSAQDISGLSNEVRQQLDERLREIEKEREQFNEQFGQLTTARQLNNAEEELLATLVLMNNGETTDHNGEFLAVRYSEVLEKYSKTLVKSANDQIISSDLNRTRGCDYLDDQDLEASKKYVQEAIALLQGAKIKEKEIDKLSPELQFAIRQLRTNIIEKSSQNSEGNLIQQKEQLIHSIDEQIAIIKRIKPIYDKAIVAYNNGNFKQAWELSNQIQAHRINKFSSQQLATLHERSLEARERQLIAELSILQDKIQLLQAQQQFHKLQDFPEKIHLLDPQFQSEKVDTLKKTILSQLKSILELEKQIAQKLSEARQELFKNPPNIKIAQDMVLSILSSYPHNEEAKSLLNTILERSIKEQHKKIEEIIDQPNVNSAKMYEARTNAAALYEQIAQITDPQIKRVLNQTNTDLIEKINRLIENIKEKEKNEQTLNQAIQSVEHSLRSQAFEIAEKHLNIVRSMLPAHDPRLTQLETTLREEWGDALHRQVEKHLSSEPPKTQEAQQILGKITSLGYQNNKTANLHHQAQLISLLSEATTAFDRGEFARVIQLLETADMTHPSITDLLKRARHLEAKRLYDSTQWLELLSLLNNMGALSEEQLYWQRVATFEITISKAQDELRNKEFDKCETSLNQARDLSKFIAISDDRMIKLSQSLQQARSLYLRIDVLIQAARAFEQNYATNHNLEELLKAIKKLEEALKDQELQPDDVQRKYVHQLHNDYTNEYNTAISEQRKKLLVEANNAIQLEDIATAFKNFNKVLNIMPNGKDPEADLGIERSIRKLKDLRDKQVEEVEIQLNLKGKGQLAILPQALNALKQKTENLRNINSDIIHEGLNRSLSNVEEAERLLDQAETILNTIRTRWATLRSNALNQDEFDHHEIDSDIQRGIVLFDKKTYIHTHLDRTRAESISKRIDDDLNDLKNAQKHFRSLQQALSSEQRNQQEIISSFEQLQIIEERLYKTTLQLIKGDHVTSLTTPNSYTERYPRQGKIIQLLRDEIERLKREEKHIQDINKVHAMIVQRQNNEALLQRLAPHEQINDINTINSEQIKQWNDTLTSSTQQLEQAQELDEQARYQDEKKLLELAVKSYEQALALYETVIKQLKPLTNIKSDYSAIELLVQKANEALATAQHKQQKLQDENRVDACKQRISQSQLLIDEAQNALNNGDFSEAKEKAIEARNINPTLEDKANTIVNACDAEMVQANIPVGTIVTVIVIIVLIALGFTLGPALWAWISEFLFPVS
jgi:hypothetical protein